MTNEKTIHIKCKKKHKQPTSLTFGSIEWNGESIVHIARESNILVENSFDAFINGFKVFNIIVQPTTINSRCFCTKRQIQPNRLIHKTKMISF